MAMRQIQALQRDKEDLELAQDRHKEDLQLALNRQKEDLQRAFDREKEDLQSELDERNKRICDLEAQLAGRNASGSERKAVDDVTLPLPSIGRLQLEANSNSQSRHTSLPMSGSGIANFSTSACHVVTPLYSCDLDMEMTFRAVVLDEFDDDSLFAKKIKKGDKLGSENDYARQLLAELNNRTANYFIEDTHAGTPTHSRKFTLGGDKPDFSIFLNETRGKDRKRNRLPMNYITVIECKVEMEEKHYGQIFRYLERILLASPGRRFIIGAMADWSNVVFFKVTRPDFSKPNVKYSATRSMPLMQILHLLRAAPDNLGHVGFSEMNGWIITDFLGQSVNYVVEVTRIRDDGVTEVKAAKIFHNVQDAMREEFVWNALTDAHGDLVPLVRRIEHTNVLIMPKFADAIFDDETKSDADYVQSWTEVWDSLTMLHQIPFIHADVRMANIMKWDNGKFGMIDFGYSVAKDEERKVDPFTTSSRNAVNNCPMSPLDDAISLLKCRYYYDKTLKSITPGEFIDVWDNFNQLDPKTPFEEAIYRLEMNPRTGDLTGLNDYVKASLALAGKGKNLSVRLGIEHK